jgi:hypothetical protein
MCRGIVDGITVARLLANPHFVAAIPGHLPGDRGSQARLPLLMARLKDISGIH